MSHVSDRLRELMELKSCWTKRSAGRHGSRRETGSLSVNTFCNRATTFVRPPMGSAAS
jgi:hypothetical protein